MSKIPMFPNKFAIFASVLGAKLGLRMYIKDSGNSIRVNMGYGLLVITMSSIGQSMVYRVANATTNLISGNDGYLSFTRDDEYNFTITSNDGFIAYCLGFSGTY